MLHAPPKDIAILGGGISGLSTALFVLLLWERVHKDGTNGGGKGVKAPRITIYEEQGGVGGWMKTARLNASSSSPPTSPATAATDIYVENGPRTIRIGKAPSGSVMLLWLIHKLGMADKVVFISKKDPAVKERYLYFGERGPLWRMPAGIGDIGRDLVGVNSKFRSTGLYALWNMFTTRKGGQKDESVSEFFGRLFGRDVVDRFLSAMVGGIWAGDVKTLSMRGFVRSMTPLQGVWAMYQNGGGVNLWGVGKFLQPVFDRATATGLLFYEMWFSNETVGHGKDSLGDLLTQVPISSAFYMREGLGQVSGSIGVALRMMEGVEVKTGSKLVSIGRGENGGVTVRTLRDHDGL